MSEFFKVIGALLIVFLIWYLYRVIKQQPEQFSKAALGKSLHTTAILALILIGFIWLCVSFLSHT